MTSISSGIDPQNGDATEHSCGGLCEADRQGGVADADDGEVPKHPCNLRRHGPVSG